MNCKKYVIIVIFVMAALFCSITFVSAYSNTYPDYNDYEGGEIACTHYAKDLAWEKTGVEIPNGWGNAGNWYGCAQRDANFRTGTTPAVNSLAVWGGSQWGHVAFVDAVSGNQIHIMEAGATRWYGAGSHGVGTRWCSGVVGSDNLLGYIYLGGSPAPTTPFVNYVDNVSGGPGSIYLKGWVFNKNNITKSIQVHAYIDGGPGSGAPGYAIDANVARTDVDNVHHCGAFHGFDYTIIGISEGAHVVQLFANDQYTNESTKIGEYAVTVKSPKANLDVNFYVDGRDTLNLDGIGTIQVYVDGQLQTYNGASSYTDFCQAVTVGRAYEVKVNITNAAYCFAGVDTANSGYKGLTGTTSTDGTYVRIVVCRTTGYDRVLPDGDYMILSALDSKYYLDIEGAETPAANSTNITVWGPHTGDLPLCDIWSVKYSKGYYEITQAGTSVALDVTGGGTQVRTNVQAYNSNGTDAQKWAIAKASTNDGYTVQAKCNDYYLTVQGGVAEAGTNVYVNNRSTIPSAQSWKFIPCQDKEAPVISNVVISDVSSTGYTVTCDVSDDFAVEKVEFPTWTIQDGKDDIIWLQGSISGGKATCRIQTSDYKRQAGCTYMTHIYVWDYAGNHSSVGQEVYEELIVEVPSPISNVQVTNVSSAGYTVICDLDMDWGVKQVEFPTWTIQDGKDDIIWLQGSISGGKAICRIQTSDYKRQAGCTYMTHIYVWDYAGNHSSVGQEVYEELIVEVPSPISNVQVTNVGPDGYTVTCDIDYAWGVERVQFPSWTVQNGQDDLIWHPGTISEKTASFRVQASEHNNETNCDYVTHIYVWDNAGNSASVSVGRIHVGKGLSITDNGANTFTAHLIGAPPGDRVFFAAYKDSRLVDIQCAAYQGEDLTFTPGADYDKVKIMLLDPNFRPLCPAWESP